MTQPIDQAAYDQFLLRRVADNNAQIVELQHEANPDYPMIAWLMFENADIAYRQNDYLTARETLEHVLKLREAWHVPEFPEVRDTLAFLGIVHQALGDLQSARMALKRAVDIGERMLGHTLRQNDLVSNSLLALYSNKLAEVCAELMDLPAARSGYERALAISDSTRDADGKPVVLNSVLSSLSGLMIACRDLGDLPAAMDAGNRALRLYDQGYFADQHELDIGEFLIASQLGFIEVTRSNAAEAKSFLQRALNVYEQGLESAATSEINVHEQAAACTRALTDICVRTGNLLDAYKAAKRVLAIDERHSDPDGLTYADDLRRVGVILSKMGNQAGAVSVLEKALLIYDRICPTDAARLAPTLNNAGQACTELGRHDKAIAMLERAVRLLEEPGSQGEYYVAVTVENLAIAYGSKGDLHEAKQHFEKALLLYRRLLGESHPKVVRILQDLDQIYDQLLSINLMRPDGDAFPLRLGAWRQILQLARVYGWKPLGTTSPTTPGWKNQQWDTTDYFSNCGQLVSRQDAMQLSRALGEALRAGWPHMQAPNWDATAQEWIENEREALSRLVYFCQAGAFRIH